jgi:hypothetical protein
MCPHCDEVVYLDETIDPTSVTCPNCLESFDITEDCPEEGCDGCSGCDK